MVKMTAKRQRELVKFLLELVEIDPASLAEPEQLGASLTLASKLLSFGMNPVLLDHPKEPLHQQALAAHLREEPQHWLKPIIDKVRKLLDAAADGQVMELPISTGSRLIFDGSALKLPESAGIVGNVAWRISAGSLFTFRLRTHHIKPHALAAVFMFSAMRALDSEHGVMVRRCKQCARVFLAGRPKQVYCSRRCTQAANFKAHVEREGVEEYKEYHREVARKSYHNRKETKRNG